MNEQLPIDGNAAIRWIFHPRVPEELKTRLRAAVYAAFEEAEEEADGRRPHWNQSVHDWLDRIKGERK